MSKIDTIANIVKEEKVIIPKTKYIVTLGTGTVALLVTKMDIAKPLLLKLENVLSVPVNVVTGVGVLLSQSIFGIPMWVFVLLVLGSMVATVMSNKGEKK